ncbi:calcium/calmodulin-dependent protein kinase type 1D-like [Penaeus monodon]|uniref:calcium/calmodulin-dependent protein kinase type 1D-like n=1 Tax=Penaeus monodon TaxID=6687 RepID=UPI0018A7D102|nr:calcium/calmodulin-dependent protein kinase type 1D-like [Penaeus monodon]
MAESAAQISPSDVDALELDKISFLGEGAFGYVDLVVYDGQQCALKIGLAKKVLPSFENERAMMEQVAGAGGAPRVLAFCPERPALVMTFCGATDLIDIVQKLLFREERDLLTIALQLTQAVRELHQKGVVHCDLKPDNVVVQMDDEGRPQTEWYCRCYYSGDELSLKCDMPGLGSTIAYLMEAMHKIPKERREILAMTSEPDHDQRLGTEGLSALLQRLL